MWQLHKTKYIYNTITDWQRRDTSHFYSKKPVFELQNTRGYSVFIHDNVTFWQVTSVVQLLQQIFNKEIPYACICIQGTRVREPNCQSQSIRR